MSKGNARRIEAPRISFCPLCYQSRTMSLHLQRGDFSSNGRLFFLSLVAILIGSVASVIAKGLLLLISIFTNLFYFGQFSVAPANPSMEHWGLAFIFVPALGGLIIGLMAYFGSEKIRGHGIPEALEAILFGRSIMAPKVAVLKPISSAISIGSGGPFGAEGPIIMTGGAIGSLIAQCLHLTAAERKTLLVAGAAAGMSAVFATPVAAVLLAVELLLFEWKPRSLVPVALASASAAILRVHLLGPGPIFPVASHAVLVDSALLGAAFVGVSAGLLSHILSKSLYRLEDLFHQLPFHWMWWPAIGGLIVGIGGYFEPRALGVGYTVIDDLLNGHLAISVILGLLAVKMIIWLVALASGTSGGVLAPLLIFGCALGTLEAQWLPGNASPGTWALIGMAAVMGGMMRSPFTAIFFAFELTKDTEVLLPLLIASLCSYAFTVIFMKRSILTEKIARRGHDIFREYAVDPLERMTVKQVMNRNPICFEADEFALDLNDKMTLTKQRVHPIIQSGPNNHIQLLGLITISDFEKIAGLDDISKLTARDLIQREPILIGENETCREAADRMAEHDVGQLLVVAAGSKDQLLGLVSRTDLLKARRLHFSEESTREKILFSSSVTR